MLYDNMGIDYQMSRLEQYQDEFALFESMCYADIREMNMIHEGVTEEELTKICVGKDNVFISSQEMNKRINDMEVK